MQGIINGWCETVIVASLVDGADLRVQMRTDVQ